MTAEEIATCIYECVCEHDPVSKDEDVWRITQHIKAAINAAYERQAERFDCDTWTELLERGVLSNDVVIVPRIIAAALRSLKDQG